MMIQAAFLHPWHRVAGWAGLPRNERQALYKCQGGEQFVSEFISVTLEFKVKYIKFLWEGFSSRALFACRAQVGVLTERPSLQCATR
jgi:hypothetical protein